MGHPPTTPGLTRRSRLLALGAVVGTGLLLMSVSGIAETKKYQSIDLEISKRKVTSSNTTIRITEGQKVRINWTTDERVELHLHGYDIQVIAEPGEPTPMTFRATTAGRFPITAHNFDHGALVYLEIYPE